MTERRKILFLIDWFVPGFKAGGPIRSLVNLIEILRKEADVFVITSDRDLGDERPYPNIKFNTWVPYKENVQVWYNDKGVKGIFRLKKVIADLSPDIIHFNSMFSVNYMLLPLLFSHKLKTKKLILAPRGMLHQSALNLKHRKKNLFLQLLRKSGIQKKLVFHAVDSNEKKEIIKTLGNGIQVKVASNLPVLVQPQRVSIAKNPGHLKVLYLGRIAKVKNLLFLIQCVSKVSGSLEVNLYGPNEDEKYVEECETQIKKLPQSISVSLQGQISPKKVSSILQSHHVLFSPSLGENFGHTIFESLLHGRPVLIGQNTPWRGLEVSKAGWDLPLESSENFVTVLERLLEMKSAEYEEWEEGAYRFANKFIGKSEMVAQNRALFDLN